ncbi:MAG: hypothetical protein Wins2KO_04110 [Winogradskyella sp.]
MKKLTFLITFLTLFSYAQPVQSFDFSEKSDKGFLFIPTNKVPADKQLHTAGHMFIGFTSYLSFEHWESINELEAIIYSFGISNIIGFQKEFQDESTTGFDWGDIRANLVGWAIGTYVAWQLRKWAKNKVKRMSDKERAKYKIDKIYN